MRFWIDMSTPKEVLFFKVLKESLEKRGHSVFVTTREYGETNDLLTYFGIKHTIVGKFGKTRVEKLKESSRRVGRLCDIMANDLPDCAITLANPEVSRVAFGLGVPLVNFIDCPEAAKKVCTLALPLSSAIFIPFHVERKDVRVYYNGKHIYTYDCLDPVAWMPVTPAPVKDLGLDSSFMDGDDLKRPFILYRDAETNASYYEGRTDVTMEVVSTLGARHPDYTFYGVPRYSSHKMVDMQSLLYHADLVIGNGGTMIEEACYWGTWTVSCRPFATSYDRWLSEQGCAFYTTDVEAATNRCERFLAIKGKNAASLKIRSHRFPTARLTRQIERISGLR